MNQQLDLEEKEAVGILGNVVPTHGFRLLSHYYGLLQLAADVTVS